MFKVKRRYIAYVQFIVEAYEGMANITTVDPYTAVIQISIMPDFVNDIIPVIKSIKDKYCLEEITE